MIIELGCGEIPINENTEHIANRNVDFTCDALRGTYIHTVGLSTELPYLDSSVDGFVSQHLIEHHCHYDVTEMEGGPRTRAYSDKNVSSSKQQGRPTLLGHLREVNRVLRTGGFYETMCPNFAYIAEQYLLSGASDRGYAIQLMQWAMGGQRNKWDYHCILLDFNILSYWAHKSGFTSIELLHPFNWFGLHALMRK